MSELNNCKLRARPVENFLIIWLNLESDEFDERSLNKLRKIINSIKTLSDTEQCIDYISQIQDEKIFMINNQFDLIEKDHHVSIVVENMTFQRSIIR